MFTTIKTRVIAASLLLLAGFVTTTAFGQDRARTLLRPTFPTEHPDLHDSVPRLGFSGHFDYGHGMHVDYVPYGSIAWRVGLEADDVIVGINGQRIRSLNHYYSLLRHSGSRVVLHIEDHRTGRIVSRTARLDPYHSHPLASRDF
jgi:S1-C subfamily serine protease